MKQPVKGIVILVVLILLAYGIWQGVKWGKAAYAKFDFTMGVGSVDWLSLFSGTGTANFNVNINFTNNNNFNIPVPTLYLKIYYAGQLLANTTNPIPSFSIPKNGSIAISPNITAQLGNNTTGQLVSDKLSGKPLTFTYTIYIFKGLLPIHSGTFTE